MNRRMNKQEQSIVNMVQKAIARAEENGKSLVGYTTADAKGIYMITFEKIAPAEPDAWIDEKDEFTKEQWDKLRSHKWIKT